MPTTCAQPFYITSGWQQRASTIKRAVLVFPGKVSSAEGAIAHDCRV